MREELYNSGFPGQMPENHSCKKGKNVQKNKTQAIATEKGRCIFSGPQLTRPLVKIRSRHEGGPLSPSLLIRAHPMGLLSFYGK